PPSFPTRRSSDLCRRRRQRNNIPHDVSGWNLLAPRDTARHHEDHSQLHATNIRERRTARCTDLLGTSPSSYQHPHSTRPSSVLHCPRKRTHELERRIGSGRITQPFPSLNSE